MQHRRRQSGMTDRQTDRQTDKQTDCHRHTTHDSPLMTMTHNFSSLCVHVILIQAQLAYRNVLEHLFLDDCQSLDP